MIRILGQSHASHAAKSRVHCRAQRQTWRCDEGGFGVPIHSDRVDEVAIIVNVPAYHLGT